MKVYPDTLSLLSAGLGMIWLAEFPAFLRKVETHLGKADDAQALKVWVSFLAGLVSHIEQAVGTDPSGAKLLKALDEEVERNLLQPEAGWLEKAVIRLTGVRKYYRTLRDFSDLEPSTRVAVSTFMAMGRGDEIDRMSSGKGSQLAVAGDELKYLHEEVAEKLITSLGG